MRLRIFHETTYRYGAPAKSLVQLLRLTPGSHIGQFVRDWRIDLDQDGHLRESKDAFGNILHSLSLDGPLDTLIITASGEVETEDTAGVVRGQVERFPRPVFLRETSLTHADAAVRAFADDLAAGAAAPIDFLHNLNRTIHAEMKFDTVPTDVTTAAAEAFAHRHGVCQDFAHVFIAAARHRGIPARYVSGHLFRREGSADQPAGHGWAEALVDGLGWVAFDPANGISATEDHVRVAVGLDYLGAAPVRGTRFGGTGETLTVRVSVESPGARL